ncbi:MAG: hypothetical protein A2Y14_00420 [Verrucomicrobia bacterium GWF2_51_19]|nr:MAG: hypothetical protein A2Y14_00420 [Verrucomicrobia bacterium GWF2_51_19]HCJ12081.1 hypothetical protein [Opitutae bacterium]
MLNRWTAVFWAVSFLFAGNSVQSPQNLPVAKLSQEEARELVDGIRAPAYASPYRMELEVTVFPRSGTSKTYLATLLGEYREGHEWIAVSLVDAGKTFRWVFQNGSRPRAWANDREMTTQEFLLSLHPDIPLDVYDLLMPFRFWESWQYMSAERLRARPAHTFRFSAQDTPTLYAADVVIDGALKAPLKAVLYTTPNVPYKTYQFLNFKKFEDEWAPETIDCIDAARNKVRLQVKSLLLHQTFPTSTFSTNVTPVKQSPN